MGLAFLNIGPKIVPKLFDRRMGNHELKKLIASW
jgi:hypothetical protein